uniref:Uncharacterized protein n=1 Tax=Setaria italica TaxID=4555 RepID=K3ZKX7_SETIT
MMYTYSFGRCPITMACLQGTVLLQIPVQSMAIHVYKMNESHGLGCRYVEMMFVQLQT